MNSTRHRFANIFEFVENHDFGGLPGQWDDPAFRILQGCFHEKIIVDAELVLHIRGDWFVRVEIISTHEMFADDVSFQNGMHLKATEDPGKETPWVQEPIRHLTRSDFTRFVELLLEHGPDLT